MFGKDAHLPDGFADLIAAVHLDKEALQTFRREIPCNALRVSAGPGFVDGPVTEIRGKDLDGDIRGFFPQKLNQGDGDRVGFLAGGASRHPYPDWRLEFTIFCDLGKDLLSQGFKCFRVPEKAGHVDQNVMVQSLHFSGVVLKILYVILCVFHFEESHAPQDSPFERRMLVIGKINTGGGLKEAENLGKIISVFREGVFGPYSVGQYPGFTRRDRPGHTDDG